MGQLQLGKVHTNRRRLSGMPPIMVLQKAESLAISGDSEENLISQNFNPGTFHSHGKTFLQPPGARTYRMSSQTSQAHTEAVSFVEEHSNRMLEAQITKLVDKAIIDPNQDDDKAADKLIRDINL